MLCHIFLLFDLVLEVGERTATCAGKTAVVKSQESLPRSRELRLNTLTRLFL